MIDKIAKEDIVMLNYATMGTVQNGIIKKPITAFGKNVLGFEENGEFMNFIIDTSIDPGNHIDEINSVIEKMQDSREEIEEYFFSNHAKWILDENNTEILDKWYDTLEVISGVIVLLKPDEIYIEYMCRDCISDDEYYLGYILGKGFYKSIED